MEGANEDKSRNQRFVKRKPIESMEQRALGKPVMSSNF